MKSRTSWQFYLNMITEFTFFIKSRYFQPSCSVEYRVLRHNVIKCVIYK